MQINLLKRLVERIANPIAVPIVEILYPKIDVNEFLIAKKMNMNINQVRNILYKLSADGLVSFIRKKDKRKGWYIYFWTLNTYKCLIKIEADISDEIKLLKEKLQQREKNRFYTCKTCNIELSEEKALEHDFSCEECAELYTLADSTEIIKELTNKISRKERDLNNVKAEVAIIEQEEGKKKIAKQKKYEKEKQAERTRRKIEREKDKSNKKIVEKRLSKRVTKKTKKKIMKKIIKKFEKRK